MQILKGFYVCEGNDYKKNSIYFVLQKKNYLKISGRCLKWTYQKANKECYQKH